MKRLVLLSVLALAGCSFLDPLPPPVSNACVDDDECAPGICSPEGRCEAQPQDELEFVLQVAPQIGAGDEPRPGWSTRPQTFEERDFDFRTPPFADVVGTVRWNGMRVPAEVLFIRPGLPGRPEVVQRFATFAEVEDFAGQDIDFRARVAVGHHYQVEIRPTGEMLQTNGGREERIAWHRILPPWRIDGGMQLFGAPDTADRVTEGVNWTYPEDLEQACLQEQEAPRTKGCRLDGRVVSLQRDENTAEANLQVRAIDNDTGVPVSSTALTDGDGSFSLRLSPTAGAWSLRVTGGSERPLFPNITVNPGLLYGDGQAVIQVPRSTPVSYRGRIETFGGDAVVGATVTFVSEESILDERGVRGSFRASAHVDGEGEFDLELVPGDYEVVITPGDDELAVTVDNVSISAEAGSLRGQAFRVARRTRLGGVVRALDGQVMSDVAVEAVALGHRGGDVLGSLAHFNRSSSAVSYETGRFDLPLDVGAFDIVLKPPAGSDYAWRVLPNFRVATVDEVLSQTFDMTAPVPLRGRILNSQGEAEAGAQLRVLGKHRDGRFIEIATGRTGEDGRYELLLPPRLRN